MRKVSWVLAGFVGISLVASVVQAAPPLPPPTLQYDTWPAVAGNVVNTGSSAVSGTLIAPGLTTYPGPGPDDGTLTAPNVAVHFADGGGNDSTGINSNVPYTSLVGADGSMTMSAWVNLDSTNSADHMVFGTIGSSGNQGLHLGFRNGQAYFGFWGNDSAQNVNVYPAGSWHYFTWQYDATTNGGTQSIYEDGALLGSDGNHAAYSHGGNLTIGTDDFSNGSIDGSLDDVRVYNQLVNAAQLYADAQVADAIPEPASLGLLGLGAIGMLARRRRA